MLETNEDECVCISMEYKKVQEYIDTSEFLMSFHPLLPRMHAACRLPFGKQIFEPSKSFSKS